MYRYYLTQQPPSIGTRPRGALKVHPYDNKQPVEALSGRSAWGYVEYDEPLAAYVVDAYELIETTIADPDYDQGTKEARRVM